ncbi:hypothetical protein VFPPC_17594 [Pochonia chlamydosporia 170]|uniref:Uncharacterized protein n=1 Tax=Pochonia chlamydosporia 170 TaxID=1380566 RepID=A0A219AR29_METCM|nr:hypothetical protein VFPPC_17594 [Pochonia chlamydosporia 170]OWT43243.1 hypothetical protein VFPPC_17594 [Pochonia chlamydosporia 170]
MWKMGFVVIWTIFASKFQKTLNKDVRLLLHRWESFLRRKKQRVCQHQEKILYLAEGAEFDRQIFPYQVFSELIPLQKRMKPPYSVQSNFFRRVASMYTRYQSQSRRQHSGLRHDHSTFQSTFLLSKYLLLQADELTQNSPAEPGPARICLTVMVKSVHGEVPGIGEQGSATLERAAHSIWTNSVERHCVDGYPSDEYCQDYDGIVV